VRSAAPRSLALGFASAALAAETWQIAQPLFRSSGIDPSALAAEAGARPLEVGFASVFALGIAAGVFALSYSALRAGIALVRDDADARQRRWLTASTFGAGTLAALITAAVAALPDATAAATTRAPFVLLLLAVPLAAALAIRAARSDEGERAAELAAALAWDRERARALGERARRLEELDWAGEEVLHLERQRYAARRRLKELNARAIAAASLEVESERRERAALARLAQSVVGALELDRYEFVRQASARGAHELLSPRRRGAPEVRPSFDEATAPVAVSPSAVEAGRLAS
jgi:hypothetical protein